MDNPIGRAQKYIQSVAEVAVEQPVDTITLLTNNYSALSLFALVGYIQITWLRQKQIFFPGRERMRVLLHLALPGAIVGGWGLFQSANEGFVSNLFRSDELNSWRWKDFGWTIICFATNIYLYWAWKIGRKQRKQRK